jgi:hypothetical protein
MNKVGRKMRIAGLIVVRDEIQNKLEGLVRKRGFEGSWVDDDEEIIRLKEEIRARVAEVEGLCRTHGTNPGALPMPSRRCYSWMNFLIQEPNLQMHLHCLATSYREANTAMGKCRSRLQKNGKLQIEFYSIAAIFRTKKAKREMRILASEGFIGASRQVLGSLIACAVNKGGSGDRERMLTYTGGDAYQRIIRELNQHTSSGVNGKGKIYDLNRVYERVNQRYFAGEMDKPELCWTQRQTVRMYGRYRLGTDTVSISLSLDDARVPEFVVEYVMYHELLHKLLGVDIVGGRRRSHTREFHRYEKSFDRYNEAQMFLKEWSKSRRK